jgi:diapolycopene oxygenase
MTRTTVGIVGGGLGGLAAACTLAARGQRVRLFEGNRELGGKAAVLERRGFRFDMGPTILTLPQVLARIFSEAGRPIDEYLRLERLDPQWRCFYEDGSTLDLFAETDYMAARLAREADSKTAEGYRRFMHLSEQMHRISDRFFFWKSVEGMRDTLNIGETFKLSTLRDIVALRFGCSVAGTIRRSVKDRRVAQMLDHFTQYVGSSPYGSPAVLCGIAHMQTDGGVWYPVGGTRAVPEALIRLGTELGVEFNTGCPVDAITQTGQSVTGLRLADGRHVQCDAVISNMDSVRTHSELLSGSVSRNFANRREYEPACSGVVLYLGLKRRYDHLLHHNFVFSADPKAEFDAIYRQGIPAPDPSCYVAAPARTEPSVAPWGGEALYVLVHTPYLRDGQNWQQMLPAYRQRIIDKLKTCGRMPDLEERIAFESVLTPADIESRYRVLKGAIYGLASHGKLTGAFKPGNRSRDLQGLYLAGGSAHPGPGMPMALMSGWIAADSLTQDLGVEAADAASAVYA